MWLRRLVGGALLITCIGMTVLVIVGFFTKVKVAENPIGASIESEVVKPTVTISANPATISAGLSGGINWSTTGNPTSCIASGRWSGEKTAFGSESTGRINDLGVYSFTLSCLNSAGVAEASTSVNVVAVAPINSQPAVGTSGPAAPTGPQYCNGRTPCYGPGDVAKHGSAGNCWGYNRDRVININGFDVAYHQIKTGITSIQITEVCGKDLAPSLSGSVAPPGTAARDHNQNTKNNADRNEIPYFVGYFDASKP